MSSEGGPYLRETRCVGPVHHGYESSEDERVSGQRKDLNEQVDAQKSFILSFLCSTCNWVVSEFA